MYLEMVRLIWALWWVRKLKFFFLSNFVTNPQIADISSNVLK